MDNLENEVLMNNENEEIVPKEVTEQTPSSDEGKERKKKRSKSSLLEVDDYLSGKATEKETQTILLHKTLHSYLKSYSCLRNIPLWKAVTEICVFFFNNALSEEEMELVKKLPTITTFSSPVATKKKK